MKKLILSVAIIATSFTTIAQVGIGTTTPAAALDVVSTTQGFIMPRVADHTTLTVAAAQEGMQVYNTTTDTIWCWSGTAWSECGAAGASKWTNDNANSLVKLTNLSDGLTARTAGKEMVIKDNGYVGIGTDTPVKNLHIFSGTNNAVLRIESSDSNAVVEIKDVNSSLNPPYIGVIADDLYLGQNGTNNIYLKNNGDVGIGTNTPESKLHLVNENVSTYITAQSNSNLGNTGGIIFKVSNGTTASPSAIAANRILGQFQFSGHTGSGYSLGAKIICSSTEVWSSTNKGNRMIFQTTNNGTSTPVTNMIIHESGHIGIGTTQPTEKLHVVGNILATGTITPDYVFESYFEGESTLNPSYKMMSLKEIEAFTKANKHLPGVSSAKEVKEKGGIVLNRASEVQLEKIEELFLHTIEQQKQIDELKAQVKALITNKSK